MNIIMMGTGPFAVPTFQSIFQSENLFCLVTRPTPTVKRGKAPANPMRDAGAELGIPIHEPDNVNEPGFVDWIRQQHADLLVVCDYGQILSPDCLAASRFGGINLHGSLLPRYRGAAPVNWPIYFGDRTTGVSVIHMTPKLDGGPVLASAETEIGDDETAAELEPRLAQMGVPLVLDAIEQIRNWDGESVLGDIQDPSLATPARRLNKKDGVIDWSRTAEQIRNQIRAFQPWPACFTQWDRAPGKTLRLILHRVCVVKNEGIPTAEPGQVVISDGNQLVVATGGGCLSIESIQPSGKKQMAISDFLRGYPVPAGDRFYAES